MSGPSYRSHPPDAYQCARLARVAFWLVLIVTLLGSCAAPPGSTTGCVPGQIITCPCLSGVNGVQTCTATGTYGACSCSAALSDGGGLDGGGLDGGGLDGGDLDGGVTDAVAEDRSANPMGDGGSTGRMVGPDGGVVEGFGVTVTIPPGALPTMTEIRIVETTERAPEGYRAFSPVYRFEPEGTRFTMPVRVSLPYRGDSRVATIFWTAPGTNTRYERVGGVPETNTATATLTHFSQGFVADGVDYTEAPDRSCAAAKVLSTRLGANAGIPASVGLFFSVEDCRGVPMPGLSSGDFALTEDGEALSTEGRGTVLPVAGQQIFVTLSIDMSASTRAILPTVIAAARRFVDEIEARRVPAQIAIEVFAGGISTQVWQRHTLDLARVRTRLDEIATASPEDPGSTNLYGAVVGGVRSLEIAEYAFEGRNSLPSFPTSSDRPLSAEDSESACRDQVDNDGDGATDCNDPSCAEMLRCRCRVDNPSRFNCADHACAAFVFEYSSRCTGAGQADAGAQLPELELPASNNVGAFARGYLVIFTDGADTAGRTALSSATTAARRTRNQVISVGLRGADLSDSARTALQAISGVGYIEAPSADVLERDFRYLATRIAGQTRSTYLLGYCSPRRSGAHTVGVSISGATPPAPSPGETREGRFSADGFGPGCGVERFAPILRCGEGNCGGLGCGACDDRTEVCMHMPRVAQPTGDAGVDRDGGASGAPIRYGVGRCVPRCVTEQMCGGDRLTTPQGTTLICTDRPTGTRCAGTSVCIDLTQTVSHCGACGNACAREALCVEGACVCPAGGAVCDGACRDLRTDLTHCGACGNACARGASCVAGACVCPAGAAPCGGVCRDLQTDLAHCGACGNACAQGARCVAGACTCLAGQVACGSGGACVAETGSACGPACTVCDGPCSAGRCTRVVEMSTGFGFICVRLEDGTARCWGSDAPPTAGSSATSSIVGLTGVAQISAGRALACARLENSTVRCWGSNDYGQTAGSSATSSIVGLTGVAEIGVGHLHACARMNDGTVRCWGYGLSTAGSSVTSSIVGLTGVAEISVGHNHTCALLTDGTVRCWGNNSQGQLGDGTITNRTMPVTVNGLTNAVQIRAGVGHTCALLTDGSVRCWGSNSNGQLGDGTITQRRMPVAVAGLASVAEISVGGAHTCARLNDGTVRCWGANDSGQTLGSSGSGPFAGTAFGGLSNVVQLDASGQITCARLRDGEIRCWGRTNGVTNDAAVSNTALAGVAQISAGGSSTCARLNDNSVRCLGSQFDNSRDVPTQPTEGIAGVAQISVGGAHTCARLNDGTVRCWGNDFWGQCAGSTPTSSIPGLSNVAEVSAGAYHTCARLNNGTVRCWGSNDGGQTAGSSVTTPVPSLANVAQVSAGGNHTCARLNDGTVRCWSNDNLQTAGSSTRASIPDLTNVLEISAGGVFTCARMSDGSVRCWGATPCCAETSSTTPVRGLSNVVQISAGSRHVCARLNDGSVRCWGEGSRGQTGQSSPTTPVPGLTNVAEVSAGRDHTCARLNDGSVRCWGANDSGQVSSSGLMVRF